MTISQNPAAPGGDPPGSAAKATGIAVVTGASRGIGAAIAARLAADGLHVIINYASSEERARDVRSRILAAGGKAELCRFDVSDSSQVDEKFDWIAKTFGRVSVLVNNAGITIDGLLLRLRDEDLDRTLAIDLKGAIHCTRAAARHMIRGGGSVIQVSSVVGEMGNAGQSAYAAAKAGLIGFSKSVAKELASRQVRVNVIAPGYVATEMTGALTEAQKEAILRSVPLGYIAEPEDVAALASYLASPASRYVTGQVIGVNGGMYV